MSAPPIPDDFELYRRILLARRVEEWVIHQYAEQNTVFARKEEPALSIRCPTHLSIGQEACAVGVAAALGPGDVGFSTHRCHAHYLAMGGDVNRMVAELFGREAGCAHGKGGSMHLVDTSVGMMGASAIVGGSIPLAVGAALAASMRAESTVAVAFFGDGAVEQGVFHESLNLASLRRLPVLFVCENNGYATLSHTSSRQAAPIAPRAASYGMTGVLADGTDVHAVLRVAREAVARARAGEGPTLIELTAYRWMSHVGTEYDTGRMRRSQQELDEARARCPLARARARLEADGVAGVRFDAAEAEVRAQIAAAVEFARVSPEPPPAALFQHLAGEGAAWLG